MEIIFAGTGSAFTMKNFQSNTVIRRNGKNLLIDAGADIRFSLKGVGLCHKDIDALYVTHLHSDHIGGVEYIAFITYFDPAVTEKVSLIGNNELIRELWNNCLKGGLKSIQGKKTTLHDYFDVVMVKKNGKFYWEGIEFRIIQSIHIIDEYSIVPSFGLMFVDPDTGLKIYYTGDTQYCPNQILDFYKDADLIIQDCETYPFKSGVHAHYEDLKTLPDDIKKKMILQHYQDNILDEAEIISQEWLEKIKQDGFTKGFAIQGQILDTKDLEILG